MYFIYNNNNISLKVRSNLKNRFMLRQRIVVMEINKNKTTQNVLHAYSVKTNPRDVIYLFLNTSLFVGDRGRCFFPISDLLFRSVKGSSSGSILIYIYLYILMGSTMGLFSREICDVGQVH